MQRLSFACRHRFPGGWQLDAAFDTTAQVTALFGPSGSGKTSILYTVAGLLRPDWGVIRLGDRTLLDTDAGICLRPEQRHIGLLFQDHLLFPHLNVENNLLYGWRRRGRGETRVDFRRVVEVLELEHLLHRLPRNLSGGERQRVALGRSLLSGPELLLLDEPLTALDEPLKIRIMAYLEAIVDEWHVPTLYVTHDAGEARRLADDVVLIDAGKIVYSGPVESAPRSGDIARP